MQERCENTDADGEEIAQALEALGQEDLATLAALVSVMLARKPKRGPSQGCDAAPRVTEGKLLQ